MYEEDFSDDNSPTAELDSNILINSLSKELSQLKIHEKNYYELHSQLITLENRYSMLLEEKNRNEKTYDIKNNSNLKQINNLKNDIESIHSEISNQRIDNEELKINNDNLKGFLEKKLNEISKIRENIDNIKSENQFTIKSLEDVDSNTTQYKVLQYNLLQKIDELKKKKQELKSFEDKNETKKRYILEKLQIIEKTRIDNQYKNNELSAKIKELIELFQKNELELKDLKKISLTLESDYNYNQAVTKRNENDSDQVSNILKSLKAKNEETSQEISKKQNILKILEEKIMQIKLNIDSLKNQNNDDSKDKKILLNEINQIILNIKEEKNYLEKVKDFFQEIVDEDKKTYLDLDKKKRINAFLDKNFNNF